MSHGTFVARVQGAVAVGVVGAMLQAATAGVIWDGGGGTDKSWGTPANWDSDTLPPFDGTASLTVTSPSTGNTALQLGADRSIARITFGAGSTAMSLNGNTLQLTSTSTSAGSGTALWNASTSDGVAATINSNILLQSGTAGSYTGHFRENNNSSGGTVFNGSISQGAGENWTLRFGRSSARGNFSLANSSNAISAIRNDGADVYSQTPGAFGGAALTLAGGLTGIRSASHYTGTDAVSNSITLAANSAWSSGAATRLTGTLSQVGNTLTYQGGRENLTRLEFSTVSGTGVTTIAQATVAPSSMSQFSSGTLNLGLSSGAATGTIVLSGAGGHGVPTWTDFATARSYNQSGGSNTWRIDAGTASDNGGRFGGFAARGADLVVPSTLSSAAFARNFVLGSAATLPDGSQYAGNAVIVNTDISYGSVAGGKRYFNIAPNADTSRSSTTLTLAGPVHELNGKITGDSVLLTPTGQSNSKVGIVRISNAENSLTGTSRWLIGGSRSAYTTVAGTSVAADANMMDLSSVVVVFTSDAAFGGATEVNVASLGSSGTATAAAMLFEDTNPGGPTTFTRSFGLLSTAESNGTATWGSFGGDVVYTGTVTVGGTLTGTTPPPNNSMIHVQSGQMSLGTTETAATMTSNRGTATTHNKTGAGVLEIKNLTINGSQSVNNWSVRAGTLLVNQSLASGTMSVESTATLGGSGTINGATTVKTGAFLAPGNSPGVLSVVGNLALNSGSEFQVEAVSASYDAVDVTGTVNIAGSKLNVLSLDDITQSDLLFIIRNDGNDAVTGTFTGGITMPVGVESYEISYTGDYATNSTTGGNDVVLHSIVIPEPTALGLIGAAGLVVLRRRRRV